MYQSKGRGRAASTVYAGVTHDPLERLSLRARLRRAIAAASSCCTSSRSWDRQRPSALDGGAAALERPDRGSCPPDRFIPAAEEMGLLEPIGTWVIDALAAADRRVAGARPRAPRVVQRLTAPAAARLRRRARRAAAASGRRPGAAHDGAHRVGHPAEPERIGPSLRELPPRAAAGDRRLRRRLVVARAAAAAARAHAQDRPLVPARDPRGPRGRCDRPRRDRAVGRARHDDRRRGRRAACPAALPRRPGLPAVAGPLFGDALPAAG